MDWLALVAIQSIFHFLPFNCLSLLSILENLDRLWDYNKAAYWQQTIKRWLFSKDYWFWHNIYKLEVKAGWFANTCAIAAVRDRSGWMLSAGTASASLPWQRVCRRCSQRTVLVDLPQITAGSSDTCYSRRSHHPPLTRTGPARFYRKNRLPRAPINSS